MQNLRFYIGLFGCSFLPLLWGCQAPTSPSASIPIAQASKTTITLTINGIPKNKQEDACYLKQFYQENFLAVDTQYLESPTTQLTFLLDKIKKEILH